MVIYDYFSPFWDTFYSILGKLGVSHPLERLSNLEKRKIKELNLKKIHCEYCSNKKRKIVFIFEKPKKESVSYHCPKCKSFGHISGKNSVTPLIKKTYNTQLKERINSPIKLYRRKIKWI